MYTHARRTLKFIYKMFFHFYKAWEYKVCAMLFEIEFRVKINLKRDKQQNKEQ